MSQPLSPIRILYLENHPSAPDLVKENLKGNGFLFEHHVVTDKLNYLQALKKFKPEIIISDYNLKDLDSVEALKVIENSGLQIPVILLTGHLDDNSALEYIKKGIDNYLLKKKKGGLVESLQNLVPNKLQEEKNAYHEKIASSERKFRKIVESGLEVVIILSKNGRINYISPSAQHILGLNTVDAIDRNLIKLLGIVEKEYFQNAVEQCLQKDNEILKNLHISFRNKQKEIQYLCVSLRNLLEDPDINGVMISAREITIEKQAEKKLIEKEIKYRSFFENSLDAILITGVDGSVYKANQAACKLFKMTEKEICERGRNGLVDLNDPNLKVALKERELTGKAASVITMLRKDGTSFLAEITSCVFPLVDEPVLRTAVIIRDISDKQKIKKALMKSENRYRTLFELNPFPVFIFDEKTLEIVDVNEQTCKHYQYTKEELIGKNLKEIRPPDKIPELENIFKKNKKDEGDFWYAETIHLKKDGTPINVSIKSHRILINGKQKVIAVCADVTEERQMTRKLIETNEKLEIAENIAHLGYWEHDFKTNSLFCSAQIFKIFEIEPTSEPEVNFFKKFIHPEDKEAYDAEITSVLENIKEHDFKFRISTEQGVKWVHVKANLLKDKKGNVTGAKGTLQDITSQKIALENLEKSESRYKGLLYAQTHYFVRIDMAGNYSYCNYKFKGDYGFHFPNENPIGHSAFTDVMDYDVERLTSVSMEAMKNPGKIYQLEIDKRLPEGKSKTTLWDMIYLHNEGVNPEMQCVGIDISGRVKAEREKEFQANLLDKIGQGVIAVDNDNKIIYWNSNAEKMYGYSKDEVLNRNIEEVLAYNLEFKDSRDIKRKIKKGVTWTGEFEVQKKDGKYLPIQLSKSPLLDSNNRIIGIINVHSDITKLKKSEKKLKQLNSELQDYTNEVIEANQGLKQFSYIVSHNLRAPIANIIGISDMLKVIGEKKEERELLETEMFNNVDRLDNIVKDINEILSVKSNRHHELELIDLRELMDMILLDNKNLIIDHRVKVKTDFSAIRELKTVKVYIYSIIYNLLSNSIKYKKPNVDPEICISTELRNENISIRFKDNGIGIDLEKNGKYIFGLYKRLNFSVEGKGMGLFMVKTQVEMLGGKIHVESKEGEGTEFIISFTNKKNEK